MLYSPLSTSGGRYNLGNLEGQIFLKGCKFPAPPPPPSTWLKCKCPTLKLPQSSVCPPFSMAKNLSDPPFCGVKPDHPTLPFCCLPPSPQLMTGPLVVAIIGPIELLALTTAEQGLKGYSCFFVIFGGIVLRSRPTSGLPWAVPKPF